MQTKVGDKKISRIQKPILQANITSYRWA